MKKAVIYHNPKCGTSRTTLAALQDNGFETTIIEYLKTPPDKKTLKKLIKDAGLSVRETIRAKELLYTELQLDNPELTDEELLNVMLEHPILINRPIVITDKGTRLCRPSEIVQEII